jgi:hypothetical protein
MPRVRFSPLVEEIHGTLYDIVLKKSPKGNMIVTKRADMSNGNNAVHHMGASVIGRLTCR